MKRTARQHFTKRIKELEETNSKLEVGTIKLKRIVELQRVNLIEFKRKLLGALVSRL